MTLFCRPKFPIRVIWRAFSRQRQIISGITDQPFRDILEHYPIRFDRPLDDTRDVTFLRWELLAQLPLPRHRSQGIVDTQHLMISGHHLAGLTGLAGIEENKILDNIQQPGVLQHSVKQHFGFYTALIAFFQPFPLGKMLPPAGDRSIPGAMSIADDEKSVMVKSMGDDMRIEIVTQIAVKPGADIIVNRLQFDKHQGQTVDEAYQIGPSVVAWRSKSRQFQFPDGQKTIVRLSARPFSVAKIDDPRPHLSQYTLIVMIIHRRPIPNEPVEILIVLEQRAGKIVPGHLFHGIGDGRVRQ